MKIQPFTWIFVGLCLAAIALSFGYFQYYEPNMKQAEFFRANTELLNAEANKQKQAEKRVADATAEVQRLAGEWQTVVATKTPPQDVNRGGINLAVNRYNLTVDSLKFRDSVQRAINSRLRVGGVTVISGPTVPAPTDDPGSIVETYYNYPGVSYPVAIFDLGQIEVRGTFDQITANVRQWSNMPGYLAVVDGLALTGTSPVLTGTYNLTIVAYVRGKSIAPPITAVGGGAITAGAPGGAPGMPPGMPPGAMRGGMPGMPPGATRGGMPGMPGGQPGGAPRGIGGR
jgi:hypothetical protein